MDSKIRILLPSLDEESDPVVLRGVIAPESLPHLKVDPAYQREKMTPKARREIISALEAGLSLPDIELGMRGDRFDMHDDDSADLQDPVFIIDGYQRTTSIIEHRERFPGDKIRLGALIHFKTNQKYERDRFHALNLFRTKVAPSVLLRNCKEQNAVIASLYGLSKQRDGVLFGRVCWSQNMSRGELINALTLAQLTLIMHGHLGPVQRTSVRDIPDATEKLLHITGLPLLRGNVTAFWELIDTCYGLRAVHYAKAATWLRGSFLKTLARLMSDHVNFWSEDDRRLQVPPELKKKLAKFPLADPEIIRLASASGKAAETLYIQLLMHLNAGKRTRRLKHRSGSILPPLTIDTEGEDDEDAA